MTDDRLSWIMRRAKEDHPCAEGVELLKWVWAIYPPYSDWNAGKYPRYK